MVELDSSLDPAARTKEPYDKIVSPIPDQRRMFQTRRPRSQEWPIVSTMPTRFSNLRPSSLSASSSGIGHRQDRSFTTSLTVCSCGGIDASAMDAYLLDPQSNTHGGP